MKCHTCGEEIKEKTTSYCQNCGTNLSLENNSSSADQQFNFKSKSRSLSDYTNSVPSPDNGIRSDDSKLDKQFLSRIVDSLYLLVSIFVLIQLLSGLSANNQDLISQLFIRSERDILYLLYISLLLEFSIARGWANIQLDPPDPVPEVFRTRNTIVAMIVTPLFFVLFPYFIFGIGMAFLFTLTMIVLKFFSPSRERKKALLPEKEKKLYIPQSDRERLRESTRTSPNVHQTTMISFDIQKSGFIERTYRISYTDDRVFMIAKRSTLNRVGLYFLFILAFFGDLYLSSSIWIDTSGINLYILSIVVLITQIFVGIRRISIYSADGQLIGTIKGNLFFNKWKISDLSRETNATLRFGLFRSKGKLENQFGWFLLVRTGKIRNARGVEGYDSNGKFCFSIASLDSIYVRKRFRVNSDGILNPNQICMASVCIIERMFRPYIIKPNE